MSNAMDGVEIIHDGAIPLAYIIKGTAEPRSTGFFTDDQATFQSGFVVYPSGGAVPAHTHLPVTRSIVGTAELLIVRSGHCIVDIYSEDRRLLASVELVPGDAVVSLGGGHGFRMLKDTVLFEVKQGPYAGSSEKERFEAGSETTS